MQRLLLWGGIGFGILIVIIIIVTLFTRGTNQAGPNSKTGTTLTFWNPIDEPDTFKEIISRFEELNPGIKIKYEHKSLEDYEIESTNALLAKKAPIFGQFPIVQFYAMRIN